MNYIKITKTDIANGDGVRVVLWVAGCDHHCFNCQNPQTWDFGAGKPYTPEVEEELFEAVDKPWIQGITFSGGDPLTDTNVKTVSGIIERFRDKFKNTKDIWCYTGDTFEHLYSKVDEHNFPIYKNIFKCDVIVDGAYIDNLRDISLKYRGSSNQRVIDVQSSLHKHQVILLYK